MQYRMILAATLALGTTAFANPAPPQITKAPRAAHLREKRQAPNPAGSSVLDAPMTIAAGQSFDGKNMAYDRGQKCSGQKEGGDSDAVFILESGASLSNVIIGPNQVEGVHCNGGCSLTNVWWQKVCEDAFSIKKQADGETTTINGGGAAGADDKVIQHNGGGTVVINDFTVSDFGKLYRSCGNCKSMPARHVKVTGGSATNGDMLVGINPNMGDTASISGVKTSGVKEECTAFKGVTGGGEPSKVGPCSGNSGGGEGGAAPAKPPSGGSSSPAPAPGGDNGDGNNSGGSDKGEGDKDEKKKNKKNKNKNKNEDGDKKDKDDGDDEKKEKKSKKEKSEKKDKKEKKKDDDDN